nr:uncharacterized protein CI109_001411 [Kwoniella shandongensis]KAA5530008.1 hypothetical protein CI109_001411 [Kwoniella shandongensis]
MTFTTLPSYDTFPMLPTYNLFDDPFVFRDATSSTYEKGESNYHLFDQGMLESLLNRNRTSRTSTSTSTTTYGSRPTSSGLSERDRLETLHTLHRAVLGAGYTDTVTSHLAAVHATGRRSKVLDVGTGTGVWAMDLANSQPYADVLAVDVDWSMISRNRSRYGNIDFLTVDITKPLLWEAETFDVIHVKEMSLEIPQYEDLLRRLAVFLRPGGLLVLIESQASFVSLTGHDLPSPIRQWEACVDEAFSARAIDKSIPNNLLHIVDNCGIFASSPIAGTVRIPVARATRSDPATLARAGHLHPQVLAANLHQMLPTLVDHSYPSAQLETLLEECLEELTKSNTSYYQRLFAVFAYKRA